MRSSLRLLAWSIMWLAVAAAVLAIAAPHLPDPVASHWGINGEPNGSMSKSLVLALPAGIILIAIALSSIFRVEGHPTTEAVAIVGVLGGIATALVISMVALNWDSPTWSEAANFGWLHFAGVLVGAAGGGAAGYLVGRRWYPAQPRRLYESERRWLADDEVASWTGTCSVRWPLYLLGGLSLVYLFLPGWFKLLTVLFLLLGFLFSMVVVRVDDAGVRVMLGGRIPVRRIDIGVIAAARSLKLEPTEWAGWGWRVVPGGSAIVLRRGDAIELSLVNQRKFAVTVDDAASGAALVNGLIDRRARLTD